MLTQLPKHVSEDQRTANCILVKTQQGELTMLVVRHVQDNADLILYGTFQTQRPYVFMSNQSPLAEFPDRSQDNWTQPVERPRHSITLHQAHGQGVTAKVQRAFQVCNGNGIIASRLLFDKRTRMQALLWPYTPSLLHQWNTINAGHLAPAGHSDSVSAGPQRRSVPAGHSDSAPAGHSTTATISTTTTNANMYPRRLRAAALERSAREEYQDFSNRTGGPHICAARGCTKIATDDGRLNADSGSDNPLYFCEEHYPEALGFYHEYKNIEPIIFPRNDFGTMLLHANDQSPSKKSTRNWWVTMSVNRHYKLLCHLRARLSREERAVLVRKAWWVHSGAPAAGNAARCGRRSAPAAGAARLPNMQK